MKTVNCKVTQEKKKEDGEKQITKHKNARKHLFQWHGFLPEKQKADILRELTKFT